MHKPVLDLLRVLSSVLTLPVHSVLQIPPSNLDSIKLSRGRLMLVAQVLLALQGLLVLPEVPRDPKGLKASQALLAL
jgi:hypothetical protein